MSQHYLLSANAKTFKVGDQIILSRLEAYYNVERPKGAPDYSVSFTFQFVFPKY